MTNPFEDFGDSGKKKRMLIPGASLASTALAMKDGKRTTWEAFGIKKKMTAVFSKTLDWSKAILTRMGGKLLEAWEWIKNPKNVANAAKGIGDRIAGWAKKLAEKAANAGAFLGDWIKDDPVGAVAGILGIGLAAGLTAGLVVGGSKRFALHMPLL